MPVLVLDFETTGKDAKECRPTEVACLVTTNDFKESLGGYQCLIYSDDYPELTAEVSELTGITNDELQNYGVHPSVALSAISSMVDKYGVTHMVAYNKEFDEVVYKEECRRQGFVDDPGLVHLAKPAMLQWLCAMRDVRSNLKYKCWKLSHLALDYGIAIDPKELHRASADVALTVDLLRAAGESVENMHKFCTTPRIPLEAVTRKPWEDGGVSTGKAKEKGFSWESPRGYPNLKFAKKWVKVVLPEDLDEALLETAFKVRRLDNANS